MPRRILSRSGVTFPEWDRPSLCDICWYQKKERHKEVPYQYLTGTLRFLSWHHSRLNGALGLRVWVPSCRRPFGHRTRSSNPDHGVIDDDLGYERRNWPCWCRIVTAIDTSVNMRSVSEAWRRRRCRRNGATDPRAVPPAMEPMSGSGSVVRSAGRMRPFTPLEAAGYRPACRLDARADILLWHG